MGSIAICESVRGKDIERVFGILKKRFRVLCVPSFLQSDEKLEKVFKCCAILHNMLLEYDGHASIGEDAADWITRDLSDTTSHLVENQGSRSGNPAYDPDTDFFRVGSLSSDAGPETIDEPAFHQLRGALTVNLTQMLERGLVKWLEKAHVCRPK